MAKIDLKFLQDKYFTFDIPVEFNGLPLYPIQVKDYMEFQNCASVLQLDKDSIMDIEVMQMSYFKWLLVSCLANEDFGKAYIYRLRRLINLCFKTDNIDLGFNDKDKPIWVVNGVELSAVDFEHFKTIVMNQNFYDYEDESQMSADFKEALYEYREVMSKGISHPSLERQIVILANERHCMESDIHNMTYRKFKMAIDEVKGKLDYQIGKTAEMSGMVTFKNGIPDWLYKPDRNKYADMYIDYDSYKGKIESTSL